MVKTMFCFSEKGGAGFNVLHAHQFAVAVFVVQQNVTYTQNHVESVHFGLYLRGTKKVCRHSTCASVKHEL